MNHPNTPHYQSPHLSAKNQPRVLQPQDIPEGYEQRSSGLLIPIQRNPAGLALAMCAEPPISQPNQTDNPEHPQQFHELKEQLRCQLNEAIGGYDAFAVALNEVRASLSDFESTFDIKTEQWHDDGSLAYLQEWLDQDTDHKIYLSATPNKIIARDKIFEAAMKFGKNRSRETFIGKHLDDPEYAEEVFSGIPQQGPDGEILPVALTIWTNAPNLPRDSLPAQKQLLARIQQTVKSARDPSIMQGVGHVYRLAKSEDFGSSLTDGYIYGATRTRRIDVTPRISGAGQSGKRTPGFFINRNTGYRLTMREFGAGDETVSHFVIG